MEENRVTLHAAYAASLRDESLRGVVAAAASEIAERHGVAAPRVTVHDDRIELDAALPATVLMVLAAELRRATGRWHLAKYGVPLWQGEK